MSVMQSRRGQRPLIRSSARSNGDKSFLREIYRADPTSIGDARHAVTEFAKAAGAGEAQLDAIRLAVSEAMTNAVQYAYPSRPGFVYLTARLAAGELWILIADNGRGIHAGPESAGLGLGLALISHSTDGLSIVERSTGGTELQLRFVL
jgi:anti-sigma regulatory factor (Ser/Thr protein kinase)